MATNEDIQFYNHLEKHIQKRNAQGKGCGCLMGLLILSGITTLIMAPNVSYEELAKKWQSENKPEQVSPKQKPKKNQPSQRQR